MRECPPCDDCRYVSIRVRRTCAYSLHSTYEKESCQRECERLLAGDRLVTLAVRNGSVDPALGSTPGRIIVLDVIRRIAAIVHIAIVCCGVISQAARADTSATMKVKRLIVRLKVVWSP